MHPLFDVLFYRRTLTMLNRDIYTEQNKSRLRRRELDHIYKSVLR